jgi:hypothetical protein
MGSQTTATTTGRGNPPVTKVSPVPEHFRSKTMTEPGRSAVREDLRSVTRPTSRPAKAKAEATSSLRGS